MASQLSQYRRLDTPVPFADVDGLIAFLGNYRSSNNFFFQEVRYQDNPGVFLDLKTQIDSLQPKKPSATMIQQDHTHLYSPQKQVRLRTITQHSIHQDTHVMYAPQQVAKKRIDTHTVFQQDTNHFYSVHRTAPDPVYSLGNPDDGPRGRIALYKNGTLIAGSEFQFLPSPLNHPQNLLSVSPGPNEVYPRTTLVRTVTSTRAAAGAEAGQMVSSKAYLSIHKPGALPSGE